MRNFAILIFLLISPVAFLRAQAPSNDECSSATVLTLGINSCGAPVNGTTENATQSITQPYPSCGYGVNGYDDDVWYSFTPAKSGLVKIDFTNITGSGIYDYLSAAVYTGTDCDNLAEVTCVQYAPYLSPVHVIQGQVYYIRAYSYSDDPQIHKSFTICAYLKDNDECANAISLPVRDLTNNIQLESGITDGATESSATPLPSCGSMGYNDDVWYKFTATISGTTVVRFSSFDNIAVQLYAGDCGTLTALDCQSGTFPYSGKFYVTTAVGEDYYIRLFSPDPSPSVWSSFNIDVFTLTPAPPNDDCDNATELILGEGSCSNPAYGNITWGATPSNNLPVPTCNVSGADDDIWFRFTSGNAGTIRLYFQNSYYYNGNNAGITVQAYTGGCSGFIPVSCTELPGYTNSFSSTMELQVTASTEYYLRVFTSNAGIDRGADNIVVCAYYPPPPPVNDNCEEAVLLTSNVTECINPVSGTTSGATTSGVTACTLAIADDDVWYKFIAAGPNHKITVTPTEQNGIQSAAFEVFSGDCGNLTSIACADNGYLNFPASRVINNMTSGETYYVRVYSYQDNYADKGDFNICLTEINDDCNQAAQLTVNPTAECISVMHGSTTDASAPWNYSCAGTPDDNLWYKFTALSASHKITVTPSQVNGINDVVFEVYSGDCNNLVSVTCVNNSSGNEPESISVSNLLAGDTYYVRVYSFDYYNGKGDFDICVSTINDDCDNAISIPVNEDDNCNSIVSGTTASATASVIVSYCSGNPDDDVWYSFVATHRTHKITVTPTLENGIDNVVVSVMAGDCSSLYGVDCIDNTTGSSSEEKFLTNLVPGTTYYVRVYSYDYNAGNGGFNICINSYNADCGDALPLTVNADENCNIITHGKTVSTQPTSPGCAGDADDALWYSFVATSPVHNITITPSAGNGIDNAVMEIYPDWCYSSPIIYCVNNTSGTDPEQLTATGLSIGATYLVKVYSYDTNAGQGDFDICVSSVSITPPNDNCGNAVIIPATTMNSCTSPINGTTQGATGDGLTGFYNNAVDDDVWYSFVAGGSSQAITITATGTNPISGPVIEVFTGNCGTLNRVGYGYYSGFVNIPTIPGNTYYVRVYSDLVGSGQGDFTICSYLYSPVNDECSGSILIPVNNDNTCSLTVSATTVHATSSGLYGNCVYGTADDDVWFRFIATAPAQQVTVTPSATGGIDDAVFEVYDPSGGDCNSYLSSIACTNSTTGNAAEIAVAEGLVVGQTYYVRVYSRAQFSGQGAFTICINQTVVNDDCHGALIVQTNEDGLCSNSFHGTTIGASNTQNLAGSCSNYHDLWYKFTANSPAYIINVVPSLTSGIISPAWSLFSGDCNNLQIVACTGNNNAVFENLVVGNTYYLEVGNTNTNPTQQGAFDVCVKALQGLANETCAGAVNVPVSNGVFCEEPVTGTTVGSVTSLITQQKDVWYKFTATSIAHKISVLPTADSLKGITFSVYEGSCNTLTDLLDVDNYPIYNNIDTTRPEIQSVEGLIPGHTYYVRVFSAGILRNAAFTEPVGSFNICVSEAGNDVASFARNVPVNSDSLCIVSIRDSLLYSTPTHGLNDCNNILNTGRDAWFKFTAMDTSEYISIKPLNSNTGFNGFYFYTGAPGNLSLQRCINDRIAILGGLTVGQTYYLRIFRTVYPSVSTDVPFDICIVKAATNDECTGAISLPVNPAGTCNSVVHGSTRAATLGGMPTYFDAPCNDFYFIRNFDPPYPLFGNDLWYTFTATGTQHKVTVAAETTGNLMFQVFSGSCGNLNRLICVNNYNNYQFDEESVSLDNLIPGNTYYVRVFGQAGLEYQNFSVCVSAVEPLNDLCSNAIEIPVNTANDCTLTVTGTNVGATRSYDAPLFTPNIFFPCEPTSNNDVWYKFTATGTSHLITVTPTATGGINDVTFHVYKGTCGSFPQIVAMVNSTAYGRAELMSLHNLEPGTVYYLRIFNSDGQRSSTGSFTICISAPLLNDDCEDAIELPVNSGNGCSLSVTGTTVGATPTNGAEDVWYKFTATAKTHKISVSSSSINPSFILYKGGCNNLQQVREGIDYNAGGSGLEFQSYDSLEIGAAYYIRVRASQPYLGECPRFVDIDPTGTFTICVSAPSQPNDLIDDAITVPVNTGNICDASIQGNNIGSSFSNNSSECYNPTNFTYLYYLSDVWYKFTATSFSNTVTVTPSATGGIQDMAFTVFERNTNYSGDMQLFQRGCVNNYPGNQAESMSFDGLVPGKEYYIRIMSPINTNSQGAFTVCVTTTFPTVNNEKMITIAGAGTGSGISALNSDLYKPTSIATDNQGNFYIADHAMIRKINKLDGTISIVAGTGEAGYSGDNGPATEAKISMSNVVAADNSGNIYIGDFDGSEGRLRKVNPAGIITTIHLFPSDVFSYSGDDYIYSVVHKRKITGITTDASGYIYLMVNRDEQHEGINGATWNWYNVYRSTASGVLTELINSGQFGFGMTIDGAGNLYYIASFQSPYVGLKKRYIRKIAANTMGAETTIAGMSTFGYAGDGGPATQAVMKPLDVKADISGNLYIADGTEDWNDVDYGNYAIRKIDNTGIITTIAGTGVKGYSGDNGPAGLAKLRSPASIALDSAGNIYIADVDEAEPALTAVNRIRKILRECNGGIASRNEGNTIFINEGAIIFKDCDTIAKITATEPAILQKDVTAKVWIENAVSSFGGINYVTRHYEIQPHDLSTVTSTKITLYFTQQEFNEFNATVLESLWLPLNPDDIANKAHLFIVRRNGISSNGTGLPQSYSGEPHLIDPEDNDIIWNPGENRWEVSYIDNEYGGYFVQTLAPATELITLNLKLFLEGFYMGEGLLQPNLGTVEISVDPTEADTVTVNLWSPANLSNADPDHSTKAVLHTDGTATMQFPAIVNGNSYYIAVKHRNHIETWSHDPLMFTGITSYDFTQSLNAAYDDGVNPPMKILVDGNYGIYAGDINQDGAVDGQDMNVIDNNVGFFGYDNSDINGDGATDGQDMNFVDNNSQLGLFFARPY